MKYLDLNYGISGIYAVANEVNSKVYIGSAVDIKRRWIRHVCRLRQGTHTNPILQAAWNKHGELNFNFTVIEEVPDKPQLLIREQVWLDDKQPWKRENGYNILPTAESRFGHVTSEKTKRKLSVTTRRAKLGKPLSKEHRAALSKGHQGKPWTKKQRQVERSREYIDQDWRNAISVRVSGDKNSFYGKRHPPERLPFLAQKAAEGSHIRWHVNRGISKPDCKFCLEGS
jgi:group I intron endonuclease